MTQKEKREIAQEVYRFMQDNESVYRPVLPLPVTKARNWTTDEVEEIDPDGTTTMEYFICKMAEELGEIVTAERGCINGREGDERRKEEIADLVTVCITCLATVYEMDEKARSELFAKVNEKNRKRGYLDDD